MYLFCKDTKKYLIDKTKLKCFVGQITFCRFGCLQSCS
jgi:hypothetical protein